jgi:hypothetical protein
LVYFVQLNLDCLTNGTPSTVTKVVSVFVRFRYRFNRKACKT